jgi:hypothetical protein
VLSDHERRVLADLERSFVQDENRAAPAPRPEIRSLWQHRPTQVAAAVAGGFCLLLAISGAALSAFALLIATALVGVLWHSWPRLRNPRAGADRAPARRRKVS